MTIPANADSQTVENDFDESEELTDELEVESEETTEQEPESPEEKSTEVDLRQVLNSAVKATKKVDGKLVFPEGTSKEMQLAVTAEIQRRATQADFTKTRQANAALKAERDKLIQEITGDVQPQLTKEQEEELEDLRLTDVDQWFQKKTKYLEEAKAQRGKEVKERLKEVSEKGAETAELERRAEVLTQFQLDNPDLELNDQVIADEIPPRITKKLTKGEISFEEYLDDVADYLRAGKVVHKGPKVTKQPNLGKAGGNHLPSDSAAEDKLEYEKMIF